MFLRVIRERKRREIDPTAAAIKECLSFLPEGDNSEGAEIIRARLKGLLEIFDLIDAAYHTVFGSDTAFNDIRKMLMEGRKPG
jgi:hypothetical protein